MPKSSKIVVDFTVNMYEEESKTPTFSERGVYAQKITYTQVYTNSCVATVMSMYHVSSLSGQWSRTGPAVVTHGTSQTRPADVSRGPRPDRRVADGRFRPTDVGSLAGCEFKPDFLIAVCCRCQQWCDSSCAVSSSRDTSWYRGTAIPRDLGDTGIDTFGITVLTEVLQLSHNTSRLFRFAILGCWQQQVNK